MYLCSMVARADSQLARTEAIDNVQSCHTGLPDDLDAPQPMRRLPDLPCIVPIDVETSGSMQMLT